MEEKSLYISYADAFETDLEKKYRDICEKIEIVKKKLEGDR